MKVLSLSTYPILARLHGGQRRINAFAEFYRSLGVEFHHAAAYIPTPGHKEMTAPDDLAIRAPNPRWDGVPFIGDLAAGEAAAEQSDAYRHFVRLFERIQPDFIQLDQPFMWPVVERARREGVLSSTAVLYSSHNWEGPLKAKTLQTYVGNRRAAEIGAQTEALERAIAAASVAIVAVSLSEAETYRGLRSDARVFAVPNGVDRPPVNIEGATSMVGQFEGRPFYYFVGSAYPPNSLGFCNLVIGEDLFFHPPTPFIALCGGAVHEIVKAPSYRRLQAANEARIRIFPSPSDRDLWALKLKSHAALLPIEFGGGSNLKTAEALATGNWIIGTSTAFRGFEGFEDAAGVIRADEPAAFRTAMAQVMRRPRLVLTQAELKAREAVYWDRCFSDSGLADFIRGRAGVPA